MRVPWKVVGLAGLAGVAAGGVALARSRRAHREYDPEELRERLRRRLAEATPDEGGAVGAAGGGNGNGAVPPGGA
jgi:hypothetical protein